MKRKFLVTILLFSSFLFAQTQKQKSFQKPNVKIETNLDLGIEKVFLEEKTCEIIIVLKNHGDIIPEQIFSKGKLKIKLENYGEIPELTLKEIDKNKELNSKKILNFNTKIILNNNAKITVFLEILNDKVPNNNKKLEYLKKELCKSEKLPLKKQELVIPEKGSKPSIMQMETMPIFLYPVKNSNVSEKQVPIEFKVPEEYKGKKIKGVFYFTNKKSGEKYFLVTKNDQNNPFWFDKLNDLQLDGVYNPSNDTLKVWSYHRSTAGVTYWNERDVNLGNELPVGEYLINADLYNRDGILIKNYAGGPFKRVELILDEGSIETPTRNLGTVEDKPLKIDKFFIEKDKVSSDKAVMLYVGILGSTKSGEPVINICNGKVCGGKIETNVYATAGPYYGKAFSSSPYYIDENRLVFDPRIPSNFGTFRDPLGILVTFPKAEGSYTVQMILKLNKAEEITLSYNIAYAEGSFPSPGDGTIRYESENYSPKNGDVLISKRFYDFKWPKEADLNTRISYSTDNGINWKEIIKSTNETHYNWLVPDDFTENGKVRFQWFAIPPEEGGYIFKEYTANVKIRGIKITSPKKNTIIKPNSLFRITWEASNNPNLKVRLSWGTTANTNNLIVCTNNNGSFSWSVPDISSDNEYLKGELLQSCPQGAFYGEDFFSPLIIQNPKISFLSPTEGESILSKTDLQISFIPLVPEGFSTPGKVTIFYKLERENEWHEIASDLPTTYTLFWKVPTVINDTPAKIKATWNKYSGDVMQTYTSEINIIIKAIHTETIKR